MPAEFDV